MTSNKNSFCGIRSTGEYHKFDFARTCKYAIILFSSFLFVISLIQPMFSAGLWHAFNFLNQML